MGFRLVQTPRIGNNYQNKEQYFIFDLMRLNNIYRSLLASRRSLLFRLRPVFVYHPVSVSSCMSSCLSPDVILGGGQ